MAVVESPSNSRVLQEVDPSFAAARLSLRPLEFKQYNGHLGGHYRAALSTGLVTGVAAGGALVSFRWTNPDRVAVLLRAIVQASLTTAFGTAQETSVDLVRVNAFTAPDTGGTAVALGNDARLSPNMGPSQVSDLRVATTAALGAGTGVAESAALGASILPLGNTLGASARDVLFDALAGQEHPLVLTPGSGFRIRNLFAQGATGVVRFNFSLLWAEVPSSY
jgi:hypothetical protein